MIKEFSSTGLILFILFLSASICNSFGQDAGSNLPLSEKEILEEISPDEEKSEIHLKNLQEDQQAKNFSKNRHENIESAPKSEKSKTVKKESSKNSILKSGSSLVTVFYVLVSYLFSGPLDGPADSIQAL